MRLTVLGLSVLIACLTTACAQSTASSKSQQGDDSDDDDPRPLDAAIVPRDAAIQDAALAPVVDGAPVTAPQQDATVDAAAIEEDASSTLPSDDAATTADAGDEMPVDAATPPPDASGGEADSAVPDAGPSAGSFGFPPRNVVLADLDFATAPSAVLSCGMIQVDTTGSVSLSNWCGTAPKPIVRPQGGGPELVVIPLTGLALPLGNTLRVIGSRPVAFIVQGPVTIGGAIDASARGTVPGAGGSSMCNLSKGGDGGGSPGLDGTGAGGGGFGTLGGAGGDDIGPGDPGRQGALRGDAMLVPLLGGCGGGRGGGCQTAGAAGAGGGAVQISASGAVIITGSVSTVGGDGAVGCANDAGGDGGGSGGAILIEGDSVNVSGAMLRATGGRGGNGQGGGAGGAGAVRADTPGARGSDAAGSGGGGGGGGYGRVSLRGVKMCTGAGC